MELNKKNILITSALPYVNNVPHLGNIIGCVLSADVWSRFCKYLDNNVLFICGTDEYGTATETKARLENMTEQEICDKYHKIHKNVYDWFNIDFDYFGRTTNNQQKIISQDIFKKLVDNNFLIEKTIKQFFCPKLNTFLADRYISGTCPFCKSDGANGDQCDSCGKLLDSTQLINPFCKINPEYEIELRNTDHLFLSLAKLQDKLSQWLESNKNGWEKNAIAITKSWLDKGLEERCITRDLKWGTPVPNTEKYGDKYKDKVFYVWFDAPIGYISITADMTETWKDWWYGNNCEYVQFMAKDNVPFHSIIFPATLMGTNEDYKLVDRIASVEYLNYEDKKFSKSKGTGVFGDIIQETGIESDIWRYYLLCIRPEGSDSHFIWDDFAERNNNELVNNVGNLVNRVFTFTFKKFKSIPELGTLNEIDIIFQNQVNKLTIEYINLMKKIKLKEGLKQAMLISKLGNKYMQDREPWVLFKSNIDECKTVLHILIHFQKHLTSILYPFLPDFGFKIEQFLNTDCKKINSELIFNQISGELTKPEILFEKISKDKINELKEKFN